MDLPTLFYIVLGVAVLGMTTLPRLIACHPLAVPPLYVGVGALLGLLPVEVDAPRIFGPGGDTALITHATELIVILSLASVGLSLDRELSWKGWGSGLRLVAIAMPLCIGAAALTGYLLVGLAPAAAILLGAVLAPTDPVLAEDVQVEGPHDGEGREVPFGLTLEAGLNDALAFPFVYLAIKLVEQPDWTQWIGRWLAWDVGYRVAAGVVLGVVLGRALAWFAHYASPVVEETERQENEGHEGIFLVATIFLVYGLTELVQGYGFLAVFVAALVIKRSSTAELNRRMHRFAGQLERLLLAVVLLTFGAMVSTHPEALATGEVWIAAALLVFLGRPLAGLIALIARPMASRERVALATFGVRGIGSLYYLAYAFSAAEFPQQELLWGTVAACILLSVVVHGLGASPVMKRV